MCKKKKNQFCLVKEKKEISSKDGGNKVKFVKISQKKNKNFVKRSEKENTIFIQRSVRKCRFHRKITKRKCKFRQRIMVKNAKFVNRLLQKTQILPKVSGKFTYFNRES